MNKRRLKAGLVLLPMSALTPKSTSRSMLLLSSTPVVNPPAEHAPPSFHSVDSVADTCGSLTLRSTSKFATPTISMPKASCGVENAARVIPPDAPVTSKIGVIEPPSKPVAVLDPGSAISATISAVLGTEAESPYWMVVLPVKEALTPTA